MNAIDQFLGVSKFAVAGASTNREKYGNKVVRAYLQQGRDVIPINPTAAQVEGLPAVKGVDALPEGVEAISIVTPPSITSKVVAAAIARGIMHIWMQPGAESEEGVQLAKDAGANLIYDGPCLLVALQYRE